DRFVGRCHPQAAGRPFLIRRQLQPAVAETPVGRDAVTGPGGDPGREPAPARDGGAIGDTAYRIPGPASMASGRARGPGAAAAASWIQPWAGGRRREVGGE